jgi:trehalose 6-phosphate phosphatase
MPLNPDATAQVEAFLRAVAAAPQSLLMLDYDGTLAPFHKSRERAFSYPGISQALQEIIRTGKTRVVIISGRDAKEIIPLLQIDPCPEIWGLHGSQRRQTNGRSDLSPVHRDTAEALTEAKQWLQHQDLQDAAEFKKGSIAVHWRGLGESEAGELRRRVLLGWKGIAQRAGLNLLAFDGGVEIRAHKPNKGDAVGVLMSEMIADVPTAYLGDDTTDEHAFEALNARALQGRSLTVLVRPQRRQTAAQLWLHPPDEVLELLHRWLQACQPEQQLSRKATEGVNA